MSNKVYKTLNNKLSNMIVREALRCSYLAYVHLYAHQHLYDETAYYRLMWVVSNAYPLEHAVASGRIHQTIELFFKNYKYTGGNLKSVYDNLKYEEKYEKAI